MWCFAVLSGLTLVVGLVALRWRLNLQRHKYDRAIDLIEAAFRRGGSKEALVASKAMETVLKTTGPEPRLERPPPLLRRAPSRRSQPETAHVQAIESAIQRDTSSAG